MQKCRRIGQINHAGHTTLPTSSDESAGTTRGSSWRPATTRTHLGDRQLDGGLGLRPAAQGAERREQPQPSRGRRTRGRRWSGPPLELNRLRHHRQPTPRTAPATQPHTIPTTLPPGGSPARFVATGPGEGQPDPTPGTPPTPCLIRLRHQLHRRPQVLGPRPPERSREGSATPGRTDDQPTPRTRSIKRPRDPKGSESFGDLVSRGGVPGMPTSDAPHPRQPARGPAGAHGSHIDLH